MGSRIPVKQITSWSYSRYALYRQCPLKAKLQIIDKIKEPPNPAMERGIRIHEQASEYIKGNLSRLPQELKAFRTEFSKLRKQYKKKINGMAVEDTWSFTERWTETAWNDWVHCWVRIKLDCAHEVADDTLIITDWKTGKYRDESTDEYTEQLSLYALAALILMPHIKVVKPRLVYLDVGRIYPDGENEVEIVYTRGDIPKLKKIWASKVRPMLRDRAFAPRPNQFCNWCHYRKGNRANGGGQCKY